MRELTPTGIGAVLLTLAALGACAENDVNRALSEVGAASERDSAGGRIVESPGEALVTVLPWKVDTVPDLELGAVEGEGPAQFTSISGIAGLPGGGLVVLDEGSAELRWFEASGQHVRTSGGRGQGPGEFLRPVLVPRFQADSLLIFDRARRAFTWVASDGSGVRALGPGGRLFRGTPRASVGSRALFVSASASDSCVENQGCEVPRFLRWIHVTGSATDTLAVLVRRILSFSEAGGPAVMLTGPLDQRGLAAAGPKGLVVEGDPRFELKRFDAEGRLIAIFRVDAPPRETPRDALDRYVQRFPDPDEMRRIYELMGLPGVIPAFQALYVDPHGWTWAERFRPGEDDAPEWLVFDPEGRARGIVELPRELEVHEIGEDYILGLWTDELDVEYVRRHALDGREN